MPFGIRAADVAAMVAAARDTAAWAARPNPLEIVLRNGRPLDPVGDPDGARHMVERLVTAGATGLQLWFSTSRRPTIWNSSRPWSDIVASTDGPSDRPGR